MIGAGTMGRGIACVAAQGGYRTVLEDISAESLEQAIAWIRQSLEEGVCRGRLTLEQQEQALRLISTSRSIDESIRGSDLVIEAVPDEMETKLEIFTILDKFAKPGAILASNTSSLSVTEIATITFRAESCVGMRFFNPVPKTKLLEVVRALETSDETIAACAEVGRRMGKQVVVVRESGRDAYEYPKSTNKP
ncbi:MAG: 3-hydroxyacyl-CoA dehydrogenase NAD-binding domain-containing protein [Candidatus Acidiferrales bacterium]